MSLYLFDRERVPGVSVILAIVVVWGWLDAVEIVVGRSDFEEGGSCEHDVFFPHSSSHSTSGLRPWLGAAAAASGDTAHSTTFTCQAVRRPPPQKTLASVSRR